jgi:pilus assembly protein CpaE
LKEGSVVIRGVLICPDQGAAERLNQVLVSSGRIELVRTLDRYPEPFDLSRILRAHAAQTLFLSFASVESASALVRQVEIDAPRLPIVAIHTALDPTVLRETMRLGIREFLTDPFEREPVMESIAHLIDLLQKNPQQYEITNQIFSFLPSKAGVGTSTIALNTSAAMAEIPGSTVLLSDFDLNSGMIRFMLKLDNTYSVTDAVENFAKMDERLWKDLVIRRGDLDVLHAGRIKPNYRIDPAQIREVVAFMRRQYRALCFDLSGNLERYSVELMLESKHVLLVCTPEIPSLHVAREKLAFLRELDLASRTVAVLNRVNHHPILSPKEVEELLGIPVFHAFPNDYMGVNQALSDGTTIRAGTETGRSFVEFAAKLLGQPVPDAKPAKRKISHIWSTLAGIPAGVE